MFAPFDNNSDPDFYPRLVRDLCAALEHEPNQAARLATTASWIFHSLQQLNWCGFYLYDGKELVVGPYQGRPACLRIKPGRGVCGTAFVNKESVVVVDVHEFPGHIACDAASRSEIVIPLLRGDGQCYGVLDLDSPILGRFTEEDRDQLQTLLCRLGLSATNV